MRVATAYGHASGVPTGAEFWDSYREVILASVRPHTASGYEVAWRTRVREAFGSRELDSITTFEIEAVAATWQIKYSTKRDALACLSKVMRCCRAHQERQDQDGPDRHATTAGH